MDQIIVSCSKVERTTFPTNINGSEYTSLTGYVHEITHNANLPFSAQIKNRLFIDVLFIIQVAKQNWCLLILQIFSIMITLHLIFKTVVFIISITLSTIILFSVIVIAIHRQFVKTLIFRRN